MLEDIPAEGYAACCEAISRWDARSDVSAIRTPTLVVSGEDDVATPPEDGAFLAASIPGAELTVLPECAHLANVEQPALFARALLAHLRVPAGTEAT
jgi:3-oxoadipate enol-lactonase